MFPPFLPRSYIPDSPRPVLVLTRPQLAPLLEAWIFPDPMEADAKLIAVFSQYPAHPRDPSLDQTFFCTFHNQGILKADAMLLGVFLNTTIYGAVMVAEGGLYGTYVAGILIPSSQTILAANPELLYGGVGSSSSGVGEHAGSNWLRWSKIGALDFTQGRSNVAGQMPLPFKGTIYAILRRGGTIIVYAKNGVATLSPSGVAFGYTVLSNTGLKNKLAVIDTGDAHYYIDSKGRLYAVKDGPPALLDYREWLAGLGAVAMAFNPETRLLYIGDGTTGYCYNVDTESFGKGPATVTGAGIQDGTLYVVASGTMTIPNFEIQTDVTDFGTRKAKSIQSLEVGLDSTLTIQAAIDYRHNKQSAFLTTNWYTVDSRGQVFIACLGYEFRFKMKATAAGFFHVDSLRVNGVVHAH